MSDRHKGVRVYASGNTKRKAAKEKQESQEKDLAKIKRIDQFLVVPSSTSEDNTEICVF